MMVLLRRSPEFAEERRQKPVRGRRISDVTACTSVAECPPSPALRFPRTGNQAISMKPNSPTSHPGRQNRPARSGRQQPPGFAASRSYDSQGPDVRIRGSLQQIIIKYETLAREAGSAGNLVAVQNYLQHAEHYIRLARTQGKPTQEPRDNVEQMSAVEAGDLELIAAD